MSENNNEQFKMPPKRPRGPMGRGPGMVTEKARDFKGSTKKLIKYLGRYWAAIIAVMIFAAVSTVFSVAGPKVMGKATTALADGLMNKIAGTGGIDFDYIAKVLLFTLALYVVSVAWLSVYNSAVRIADMEGLLLSIVSEMFEIRAILIVIENS